MREWADVAQNYFTGVAVGVAAGAFLAGLVPLLLWDRAPENEPRGPRVVLLFLVYVPLAFVLGGVLFWASELPRWASFVWPLTIFVGLHLGFLLAIGRIGQPADDMPDAIVSPDEILVAAVLGKAEELRTELKDRALLDLRDSTTRLFHLLGAHSARVRLGEISLYAAQREHDLLAEASIQIDDMGWAAHEMGEDEAAHTHTSNTELSSWNQG